MKVSGLALSLLMATTAPVYADVLLLDSIGAAPANSAAGVMRPRSGESMTAVTAGYGEPESKKDPIGEPPITRWIYPAYTVYFEYQHVIDVVVHR